MVFRLTFASVLFAIVLPTARIAAQNTLQVTPAIVIAAPDSTQYTSGISATTSVSFIAGCDNGSGGSCQIEWNYTQSSLRVEYQIVSKGNDCDDISTTTSFAQVPTGATVTRLATIKKNKSCTIGMAFRVTNLSITSHLSGVNYLQALNLNLRRLP